MKKIYNFLKKWELQILFSLSIVAIILGYYGYRSDYQTKLDAFYKTLQLFKLKYHETFNFSIYLEIARWAAAIVIIYSVLQLILIFIEDQVDEFVIKHFYKEHIVICGLSWKARIIINDYKSTKKKIVIIDKNKDHKDISDYRLYSNIKVIIGDAEDDAVLMSGNILNASYVFALTESDFVNLKVADHIQKKFNDRSMSKRISRRKKILKVRVHLVDYFNLMAFKEFHKESDGKVDYHAFNLFQQAAEKVIDEFSPDQYCTINKNNVNQVHILISGLTVQGEHVILEAAEMYHFVNLQKLKVSIIDNDIMDKLKGFLIKFPRIENIIDIHPIEISEFLKFTDDNNTLGDVSVCFVCQNDDAISIRKYMMYRQYFYKLSGDLKKPKIATILPQNISLKSLFPNLAAHAIDINVSLKVLHDDFCKKSVIVDNKEKDDDLAKLIDFIYGTDLKRIDFNIANFKEKDWDNKTDFQKDWNRYPARHFIIKLRAAGIDPKEFEKKDFQNTNIDTETKLLLAKMEHRRWCAEKILSGYIAGKSNPDERIEKSLKKNLKFHKDLVDWADLKGREQKKDDTIDHLIYVARKVLEKKSIESKT